MIVNDFLYWLEDNERPVNSDWQYSDCVGKTAKQALIMLVKEGRHSEISDNKPEGPSWNQKIEPPYSNDNNVIAEEKIQYKLHCKEARKLGNNPGTFKNYRIQTYLATLE